MREIPLVNGGIALVDDEDYELVSKFKWNALGVRHGKTKYAIHKCWVKGENRSAGISMHRFIMNPDANTEVDHINHNGLDNRRVNLRMATRWQNACGSTRTDNKHGFRGVRTYNGKYIARVVVLGKEYSGGTYLTAVEAARARDKLALKLHGEFAYTNFPKEEYDGPFVDIYRRSITLDGVGENL
jgi:HNH endonuclease